MNGVVPEVSTDQTTSPSGPSSADTLRARVMFALAALDLLLVAGMIHRAQQSEVTVFELKIMFIGLIALWPIFAAEAILGLIRRDPTQPLRPIVLRAILVMVMPPFRMGLIDPHTNMIWLPRLGWRPPGKDLAARLERAFGGPMLVFAFLILPVLAIEYFRAEQVRSSAALALSLHIGVAVIWVAFATEFILGASAAPNLVRFLKAKWLDLAIVVLPMLEFLLTRLVDAAPLARLLRLGRALSPEQITGLQRVYRLRGLATKAWHAFLLLGGMGRLIGDVERRRLRDLEHRIAALEEELVELHREANEIRTKLTHETVQSPQADP